MAPYSSDPQNLRTALNLARRRALSVLVTKIAVHMRSNIELSFQSEESTAPLFVSKPDYVRRDEASTTQQTEEAERQRRLEERLERNLSATKMRQLEAAALRYFDKWEGSVTSRLSGILNAAEDPRATRVRQEDKAGAPGEAEIAEAKEVDALRNLYRPVPTRLSTISKEDIKTVVSSMLLLVLSVGNYSAHSRVLLLFLTSSLGLPLSFLTTEEREVARSLMQASKEMNADAETQKRQQDNQNSRRWKVGLASVVGAAAIGITGGLAAPIVAGAIGGIMGGVGLGGVASFLGNFAMNGALVGTLFGAFGGKMTGEMVDSYAKEVEDFKFLPIKDEWGVATKEEDDAEGRRLRVTIGVNGWLNTDEDITKPWRVLGQDSEVFALRYEMDALLQLGASLKSLVSSYAWTYVKFEILKRTVLATLWTALWPIYLLKMATSVDNPFSVARNRSEKAGAVLADALINKAQGERPVTLIGYSLGARVIYSCLNSLAERRAFGLVESVVFIGAPVPSSARNWRLMRSVVSGKIINVYSENDYILAFLYRATSLQLGVAGLQEIAGVEGVGNLNLSAEVSGHLRYPDLIGKILKRAGFDVDVEDDEIEKDESGIQLIDIEDQEKDADILELTRLAAELDVDPSLAKWDDEKSRSLDMVKETHVGQRAEGGNSRKPVTGLPTGKKVNGKHVGEGKRDADSESDDGGIQMVDNDDDDDGPLEMLEPDAEVETAESVRQAMWMS